MGNDARKREQGVQTARLTDRVRVEQTFSRDENRFPGDGRRPTTERFLQRTTATRLFRDRNISRAYEHTTTHARSECFALNTVACESHRYDVRTVYPDRAEKGLLRFRLWKFVSDDEFVITKPSPSHSLVYANRVTQRYIVFKSVVDVFFDVARVSRRSVFIDETNDIAHEFEENRRIVRCFNL